MNPAVQQMLTHNWDCLKLQRVSQFLFALKVALKLGTSIFTILRVVLGVELGRDVARNLKGGGEPTDADNGI